MSPKVEYEKTEYEARSDGRAAVAILLLTVVVVVFVASRVIS